MSLTSLREWVTRLVGTVRPRRSDTDLEQELRLHAELAAEAAKGRGDTLAHTMDAIRDQRGVPWLDDLLRDLRYGVRVLNRQRMFAGVAVLTLAIGIGATTAVFSVVDSVLLRPLRYPEPERLVSLRLLAPGAPGIADVSGDFRLSPSMYFTFAEHNRSFQYVGVWTPSSATITGVGEPEQVRRIWVTHGVLEALGAAPVVGRWLSQADQQPGRPATMMLTHGYWLRRFGFQGVARLKAGATVADANTDVARLVPIWMNSWPAAKGVNPRVYEAFRIT